MVFSLVYFHLFNNLPLFNLMNQDNDDIFNDIDLEVNHFTVIFPDFNNSEHSDYCSTDKFTANCVTNVNDLKIIHYNIRSLYAHHNEFLILNLAFFVLNLTFYVSLRVGWWTPLNSWSIFKDINHFTLWGLFISKWRDLVISRFIKDSIRAKHLYRYSLSEDHMETLFIEMNMGERTTYIGMI